MSRVDRRPTVVRNFLGGDRRSVEWALEQWMAARPPVDRVTLSGHGASVAATALGLLDVMRLRGGASLPFALFTEWQPDRAAQPTPAHALARASGAGTTTWDSLRADDVLLCSVATPSSALQDRVVRARQRVVVTVRPGQVVARGWHRARAQGRITVVPSPLESGGLTPAWEGVLEDLAPARLVVMGDGPGLFAQAISAGDFFLERLRHVPSPADAENIVATRVAVLVDGAEAPAAWSTAQDVWEDACRRAGALLQPGLQASSTGVVMIPEQRMFAAA